MRYIKPRKPRGIKLNGERSLDMCPGCHSFYCDPMTDSIEWMKKKEKRIKANVCIACGQNPCRCKSKLEITRPILVTGKNKKKC